MKYLPLLIIGFFLAFLYLAILGVFGYMDSHPVEPTKTVREYPQPTPIPLNTPKPTPVPFQEQITILTNNYRTNTGLSSLPEHPAACTFAQERSVEIQFDWSHNGFFEKAQSYPQFTHMGENLAKEYNTAERLVIGWLESPTHKANLDTNWNYGCVRCTGHHCAHIFAL